MLLHQLTWLDSTCLYCTQAERWSQGLRDYQEIQSLSFTGAFAFQRSPMHNAFKWIYTDVSQVRIPSRLANHILFHAWACNCRCTGNTESIWGAHVIVILLQACTAEPIKAWVSWHFHQFLGCTAVSLALWYPSSKHDFITSKSCCQGNEFRYWKWYMGRTWKCLDNPCPLCAQSARLNGLLPLTMWSPPKPSQDCPEDDKRKY